jgi:NAD(P)-dependent dehydrogenase (short-subunit alcohol dehydrogenase family)
MQAKQSVVITGASSGIGWATAKVLLTNNFRVFGMVRKPTDAERLISDFGKNFHPLLGDVTDETSVHKAAADVEGMLGTARLAGLVNNAGIVVAGPLLHLSSTDMRRQIDVNLMGPFFVTQAFAPLLGSDPNRSGPPGRIVQISSVSGALGFPLVGAYTASKFALEGMSESLRRELLLYGIDVIVLGPGTVATGALDKAIEENPQAFEETDYGSILRRVSSFFVEESKKGLAPEVIGEAVHRALTESKPRARYAVVSQRFKNWTLPMLLPKRLLDGLIAKQFGMKKK